MSQRLLVLTVLLALSAAAVPGPVAAQGTLSAAAAWVSSGKYASAVKQLTAAINSGKLSPAETGKAFYLRGVAYRKLGKSAQAIADLGSAIWLGLPSSDRVKAHVNRGLAYRAAGLSKQADAEIAAAKRSSSSGEVDKLIAEGGGTGGETSAVAANDSGSSSSGGFFSRFGLGGRGTPSPPPPPSEPTRTADASANWSTSVSGPPQRATTSTRAPAPAPDAKSWTASTSTQTESTSSGTESTSSGGGNRVIRWFGSLTGSSSDSAFPPPAPSQSAATPSRTQRAKPAPAPTTGWGSSTQIVTADARPATGGGSYQLQLTASRSEAEAKELWKKVSRQNLALAGRQPSIQKTDIGNLGTFYRLQVGPFQDKAESLKLCNALKRSGVDCFLVTQ